MTGRTWDAIEEYSDEGWQDGIQCGLRARHAALVQDHRGGGKRDQVVEDTAAALRHDGVSLVGSAVRVPLAVQLSQEGLGADWVIVWVPTGILEGMGFTVEWHPGMPCGSRGDGAFCFTRGDAHFLAPPPAAGGMPAGHTWDGWQDLGYVTEGVVGPLARDDSGQRAGSMTRR